MSGVIIGHCSETRRSFFLSPGHNLAFVTPELLKACIERAKYCIDNSGSALDIVVLVGSMTLVNFPGDLRQTPIPLLEQQLSSSHIQLLPSPMKGPLAFTLSKATGAIALLHGPSHVSVVYIADLDPFSSLTVTRLCFDLYVRREKDDNAFLRPIYWEQYCGDHETKVLPPLCDEARSALLTRRKMTKGGTLVDRMQAMQWALQPAGLPAPPVTSTAIDMANALIVTGNACAICGKR